MTHSNLKLALCIIMSSVFVSCACKHDKMKNSVMSYEALRKDVTILGKLGYPLGTYVQVRGKWKRHAGVLKADPVYFAITEVNGLSVHPEVEFSKGDLEAEATEDRVRPIDQSVWELSGYETGGYIGTPRGVLDRLEEPVQIIPYSFSLSFVYIRCKRVQDGNH